MSNPSKFDFTSWLESQDPNEKYNFGDCQGTCLMGQYMASKGASWSMPNYHDFCLNVLGGKTSVLSCMPQTKGNALVRVKELESEDA